MRLLIITAYRRSSVFRRAITLRRSTHFQNPWAALPNCQTIKVHRNSRERLLANIVATAIMATPAGQARAQALNAKLEGEARVAVDDIDKLFMRKVARESLVCSVKCYDKAGKTGSSEALEMCINNCQLPHRQANAMVQQEIGQFQNRLGRAMHECEDKARDQMKPGFENDAKLMAKVEDTLIGCIASTVDEYIGKLKPMKERIASQLK